MTNVIQIALLFSVVAASVHGGVAVYSWEWWVVLVGTPVYGCINFKQGLEAGEAIWRRP